MISYHFFLTQSHIFIYTNYRHGYKDTYDKERLKELKARNGIQEELVIPCKSIPNILKKLHMRKVNYMTVDTEGGEINFLSHFPFDQFVIDVIQVEIRCVHGVGCTDGETATNVMAKYGYVLHTKYKVDDETEDYFFKRTSKADTLFGIANGNFTI